MAILCDKFRLGKEVFRALTFIFARLRREGKIVCICVELIGDEQAIFFGKPHEIILKRKT